MKKEKKKERKRCPSAAGATRAKADDDGDDDDDDDDDDDSEEEVEEVDPALKVQAARFLLGAVMLDGVAWGVGKIALVEVVRLATSSATPPPPPRCSSPPPRSASSSPPPYVRQKSLQLSTMTISAPIALLGRECYAYYYCFRRMRTFTAPNAHICSRILKRLLIRIRRLPCSTAGGSPAAAAATGAGGSCCCWRRTPRPSATGTRPSVCRRTPQAITRS